MSIVEFHILYVLLYYILYLWISHSLIFCSGLSKNHQSKTKERIEKIETMTLLINQDTFRNNKSKLHSYQKKINFIGNLMMLRQQMKSSEIAKLIKLNHFYKKIKKNFIVDLTKELQRLTKSIF